MEYVALGSTGLKVSAAGLGCGGASRLGQSYGKSEAHSVGIVHAAIDAGVTLIDTAAYYGTEQIVGEAIRGRRDSVVISTKSHITRDPPSNVGGEFMTGDELRGRVEGSLRALNTDYIDIFFLHGIVDDQYDHACSLVPALAKLREEGKIRAFGVTERFAADPSHVMLRRAVRDDHWQVVMVGFHMLNVSARHTVLTETQRKGIGTLCMFAVRRALSDPDELRNVVAGMVASGAIHPDELDRHDPLSFLLGADCRSVTEAAYRFCAHEPGLDVVLSGTGSATHLADNLRSLAKPVLPRRHLERLQNLFGELDTVTGN